MPTKTKAATKRRSKASKQDHKDDAHVDVKAKALTDDELFNTLTPTARGRIEGGRVGATAKVDWNNPQAVLEEAYAAKVTADHLENLGNTERAKFYRERVKTFTDRLRAIQKAGGAPFASGRPALVDDQVAAVRDRDGKIVPGRVKMRDGRVEGQDAKAGDEVWQTEPEIEEDEARVAVQEEAPVLSISDFDFDVQHSTIQQIMAWVGEDPERAAYVLKTEGIADIDMRKTLIEKLDKASKKGSKTA